MGCPWREGVVLVETGRSWESEGCPGPGREGVVLLERDWSC